MAIETGRFRDAGFTEDYLTWLLDHQGPLQAAHYGQLWDYYRNPRRPRPVATDDPA